MNYLLKTFGCQMNYADSEKINMILLQSGLRKVLECSEADILILNTCSVRQKWEDRVYGYIREARALAQKQGKTLIVGITGCMVRKTGLHGRYYESGRKRKAVKNIELIESENSLYNSDDKIFWVTDTVDFTLRIEEIHYLTKILSLITQTEIGNDAKWNDYLQAKQFQENESSANIIIQTGCDNFCSYCIVPYTRGREKSRPQEEILREIEECVANGTKEITLLGQNVNSYGKETRKKLWNSEELKWISSLNISSEKWGKFEKDLRTEVNNTENSIVTRTGKSDKEIYHFSEEKTPFRELLEEVNNIKWLDRIRFTSSNPHDMTRDILDAHFELDHMCHHLHFALQSGSDEVLGNMNRKHTFEDFRLQVEYLRSRDPLFSISTDIIVGFPGETEEQFQETVRAFEICDFDFAFIARYSPRRGTMAADTLKDTVCMKEKARRWDILNTLLYQSVQRRNKLMLGRIEEILISEKWKDEQFIGRTRNFKEVHIKITPDIKIGDRVSVNITEMDRWILKGEIL